MIKNNETDFVRPTRNQVQANPLANMPKLFDEALTEFSTKSFGCASLNYIIKASGLNKGSFYYRFADKMDLYLCMMDKMSKDKVDYFIQMYQPGKLPQDSFEQIRFLVKQGIEYSQMEPRYYAFWRIHLSEGAEVKTAAKAAFPICGKNSFELLIHKAKDNGQFKTGYPTSFIINIIELLIYNIDTLIKPDMGENDILDLINNLVKMLRYGLARSE